MGLLDFLFPKRCVACGSFGSYLCEVDRRKIRPAKSFCPVCLKAAIGGTTHAKCGRKLSLDGLICLFDYSAPVREMVAQFKYSLVTDLASLLKKELIEKLKLFDRYDFTTYSLLPVPLSQRKKNWRGYNQTEILGKLIAQKLRMNFDSNLLVKIKETKPQAKLPRAERIKQTVGVFGVKDPEKVKNKNFIVFDDVWTTGATMKATAAVLKRKGAVKVWGIAFASSR